MEKPCSIRGRGVVEKKHTRKFGMRAVVSSVPDFIDEVSDMQMLLTRPGSSDSGQDGQMPWPGRGCGRAAGGKEQKRTG